MVQLTKNDICKKCQLKFDPYIDFHFQVEKSTGAPGMSLSDAAGMMSKHKAMAQKFKAKVQDKLDLLKPKQIEVPGESSSEDEKKVRKKLQRRTIRFSNPQTDRLGVDKTYLALLGNACLIECSNLLKISAIQGFEMNFVI